MATKKNTTDKRGVKGFARTAKQRSGSQRSVATKAFKTRGRSK